MKKDLATIFGLFIFIVLLLVFGRSFTSVSFVNQSTAEAKKPAKQSGSTIIYVRSLSVDAKIADRASDRAKGLGGRDSMPLSEGMLFVFDNKGVYPFWMKDMKFAIDIIWIDENKKIVDMVWDAAPEPKRKNEQLTRYLPRSDALYVLEINAGLARLNSLQIGDQVNFSF